MKALKGMKEVKENSVFGECEDRKDSGEFEEFEKRNNLKDSEFLFTEITKKGTDKNLRFIGNLSNPINIMGVCGDGGYRMKTHYRSIRLFNNAGMSFPECYANAPLLDLDKGRLTMTGKREMVTCKNCLKKMKRRS